MPSASLPKAGQRVAIRYEGRMVVGRVGFASENQRSLLLQLGDSAESLNVLPVIATEEGLYRSIFDDREVWIEPIRGRAGE